MLPARSTVARSALRAAGLSAAVGLLASSCYLSDVGLAPPPDAPYFPTGVLVSPGRTALYVVNSDFDLQYNGGTVEVLDLTLLRPQLGKLLDTLRANPQRPHPLEIGEMCGSVGLFGQTLKANANQILSPGQCTSFPLPIPTKPGAARGERFATVPHYAGIGAFASGGVLATNPNGDGARIFVTVRGDPSITWFDVTDDRKDPPVSPCLDGDPFCVFCAQSGAEGRCSDEHRIGLDPNDNLRFLTLPAEPVGIDISDDTRALVVAHQTQATVSLSENVWPDDKPDPKHQNQPPVRPALQFPLTDVSAGPTEVAHVPEPALVAATKRAAAVQGSAYEAMAYDPTFLVTYNATPELDLFSYHDDASSSPRRPFLSRVLAMPLTVNSDGKDSRGVVVDATDRQACEAQCKVPETVQPADLDCLRACIDIPLGLYLANRTPPTLVIGEIRSQVVNGDQSALTPANVVDTPKILTTVPLPQGPSKVAIGNVIGFDGLPHRRVFVVSFDSRYVFGYDPVAQRVDITIRTGRGPHGIAFDTGDDGDADSSGKPRGMHSYMYVGHFTDSYLGVVDLDMRHIDQFQSMFASIGTPLAPRESK